MRIRYPAVGFALLLLLCSIACAAPSSVVVTIDLGELADRYDLTEQQSIKNTLAAEMVKLCNQKFRGVWNFDVVQKPDTAARLNLKFVPRREITGFDLVMELKSQIQADDEFIVPIVGAGEFIPATARFLEDLKTRHAPDMIHKHEGKLRQALVKRVPVCRAANVAVQQMLTQIAFEPGVLAAVPSTILFCIQGKCADDNTTIVFLKAVMEQRTEQDVQGKRMPVLKMRCTHFKEGDAWVDANNHLNCINGLSVQQVYLIEPTFVTEDEFGGIPPALAPGPQASAADHP